MSDSNSTPNSATNSTKPQPAGAMSEPLKKLDEALKQPLPKIDIPKNPDSQLKDQTMGRMLGDIVWLLSQSPAHKHFSLADLEWMVMPPLALGQYRIFRDGEKPLGVAFWGYLSEETEKKLEGGATRIMPQEWAQGMRVEPEHGMVAGEGGTLWLVDLVCPFHTAENKLADICLHDLMKSVFAGKKFKMFQVDAQTRQRKVTKLSGL
jgi:cytolysin-activating lysine-acyltransferase